MSLDNCDQQLVAQFNESLFKLSASDDLMHKRTQTRTHTANQTPNTVCACVSVTFILSKMPILSHTHSLSFSLYVENDFSIDFCLCS